MQSIGISIEFPEAVGMLKRNVAGVPMKPQGAQIVLGSKPRRQQGPAVIAHEGIEPGPGEGPTRELQAERFPALPQPAALALGFRVARLGRFRVGSRREIE